MIRLKKILILPSRFFSRLGLCTLMAVYPGLPKPTEGVFSTKLGYAFFEDQKRPLYEVVLLTKVGHRHDPTGQSGMVSLLNRVLNKGTSTDESEVFHKKIERFGANVSVTSDKDFTSLSLRGFADHFSEEFNLFKQLILSPRFKDDLVKTEIEKLKEQYFDLLGQPEELFYWIFDLWTKQQTVDYRGSLSGIDEMSKISAKSLESFYRQSFVPERSLILAVGKFDAKKVTEDFKKFSEEWTSLAVLKDSPNTVTEKSGFLADLKRFTQIDPTKVVVFHREDSDQAVVKRFVKLSKLSWKERAVFTVFETLMGGTFNSRLNTRLREQLGIVYGVNLGIDGISKDVVLELEASTQVIHAGILIKEMDRMFREIVEKGPSLSEVEFAKQYLVGSFPISIASLGGVANRYASGWLYDSPNAFLGDYLSLVKEVSVYDVSQLLKKYLRGQNFQTAIFGDERVLKKSLSVVEVKTLMKSH